MIDEGMATAEAASGYSGALSFVGAGAAFRLIASAIGVAASAATVALALRLLGPVSYGRLAFALALVALVTALGRLGLGIGTAQTIASATGQWADVSRAARASLTISLFSGGISAAIVIVATVFGPFGTDAATRMMVGVGLGLLLLGTNVSWAVYSIARGLGRVAVMEALGLTVTLGQLVVIVALRIAHIADIRAVALGFGAAGLAGGLVSIWGLLRLLPGGTALLIPAPAAARALLVVLVPFAVAGTALQLIAQFDVFVLGLFGSKRQVAMYQPTLKLTDGMLQIIPFLVMGAFVPAATRLYSRGDRESFRDLYLTATKLVYVLAFGGLLLMAVFPETLLRALFGARFPARPTIVWTFLVGYTVNLALGLNVSALVSAGDRRQLTWVNLAGMGTMIVAALALIPALGPMGGALATSGSFLVWNVAASTALYRSTGVHPFRADLIVTVLTSLGVLAAGGFIRVSIHPRGLFVALLVSTGLWLAWVGLLAMLREIRRSELLPLLPRGKSQLRREFLANRG